MKQMIPCESRIEGRARHVISTGFLILLVLLWQLLSMAVAKPFLLPAPADILKSLWENRAEIFLIHLPATLQVVVIGGALSVLSGALLAVWMDQSPWLMDALYPILTVTQTIPVMCLAPVLVLMFGYTVRMRVIVVILVNFFTVTVDLADGFAATRPERAELLTTFGADRVQQFFMLRFPTALPNLFTALKISVPWSVIGAAVAEWLGAPAGLGMYSRSCMMNLDAAGLLAPLIVLTAMALIMNAVLSLGEKRLMRWRA